MTTIESLLVSGVSLHFILISLLEVNSDTFITTQDIINYRAKLNKKRLAGYRSIKALIKEFQKDEKWALHYSTTENDHVNFLFFILNKMIDIT